MMKFWKTAAKGKSGCPVRPPEYYGDGKPKTMLNTNIEISREESTDFFRKKSKLSLSLHDILLEKKSIIYFIQFMETIGKYILIKCWLELEHFNNFQPNVIIEGNSVLKLGRTKSVDFSNNKKSSEPCNTKNNVFMLTGDPNYELGSNNNENQSSTKSCNDLSVTCEISTKGAVNLFKKYIALEAPFQLPLPDEVRKTVITNICQPEGKIDKDCFKPVLKSLFTEIENNYYNSFINSPFYIKAQIDINTSGCLNLQDILYNETILFYFTEYLEQESCSVLLQFLISVMHFRDNMLSCTSNINFEQSQADAIVLYDKYFSLQATNPIGFTNDVRLQIESDICREKGPLHTCFDYPYMIVYKSLSSSVKTFLESDLYYKYLTEMVHSVNQISASKKSQSDSSSEFSVSTQNTLLAMGGNRRNNHRHSSVPDMTIDSNQLYNADALWQRKRNEGLSLGRVNSLGRFESKFEPDPDKKEKSVLKKIVSRIMPSHPAEVEEEMAWQIAHMIVKDVTDLTMSPPDSDNIDN